jgi:hypothetical protein
LGSPEGLCVGDCSSDAHFKQQTFSLEDSVTPHFPRLIFRDDVPSINPASTAQGILPVAQVCVFLRGYYGVNSRQFGPNSLRRLIFCEGLTECQVSGFLAHRHVMGLLKAQ